MSDGDARSFAFATGLFNYGFIAIPLALAVFGERTVGVLIVFNFGVEAAIWSVGIGVFTGGAGHRVAWHKMLNPPVVAILVAVTLNLLGSGDWMPAVAIRACEFVGAASIPMSLIMTGAVAADVTNREVLRTGGRVALAAVGLRNVVLPLIFLLVGSCLPRAGELQNVLITQAAMPTGMAPVMLARYYHVNPVPATQALVATTLTSVVTIPFWIVVGRWLLQGG